MSPIGPIGTYYRRHQVSFDASQKRVRALFNLHLTSSSNGDVVPDWSVSSHVASDIRTSEVRYWAIVLKRSCISDRSRGDVWIRERCPAGIGLAVYNDLLKVAMSEHARGQKSKSGKGNGDELHLDESVQAWIEC